MKKSDIPNFEERRIRDPVHGLIVFDGKNETDRFAWALLNTPEFQRLRRIKQLGFSELIYPGAAHSRFAHSIGAYHVARRLVDVVRRRRGTRNPRRETAALLAALLHDIGHGPFSHAFEHVTKAAGHARKHEEWSASIITGDTRVREILSVLDKNLPVEIATLIKGESAVDVYTTIVSSQFDADRLDYMQRDRIMTGVQFGHIDVDWLFDCLRVGEVRIGRREALPEACLYLDYKGIRVAEEYLEARFRLYMNVYMHKTTRSAEKLLEAALVRIAKPARNFPRRKRGEPKSRLARFLQASKPQLGDYLSLDDTAIWSELNSRRVGADRVQGELAARLLDRRLYKCFDLGPMLDPASMHDQLARFHERIRTRFPLDDRSMPKVIEDDDAVTGYKWYDFGDTRALKKVLIQRTKMDTIPVDIGHEGVSSVVEMLRGQEAIHRFYVAEAREIENLYSMWNEVKR